MMHHIVENNETFEAELRIKIYSPDGSFHWMTFNGEVTQCEAVPVRMTKIFELGSVKHESTIAYRYTFTSTETWGSETTSEVNE